MVASLQRILIVTITQHIVWKQVVVKSLLRRSIGAVPRRTIRSSRRFGSSSISTFHILFILVHPLDTPSDHVLEHLDIEVVRLAHIIQHLPRSVTKLTMLFNTAAIRAR